jgi:hypothetical protein
MERVRGDCRESELSKLSVEERLAARARRREASFGEKAEAGERYRGVEDYDAVLRSHCRLVPAAEVIAGPR